MKSGIILTLSTASTVSSDIPLSITLPHILKKFHHDIIDINTFPDQESHITIHANVNHQSVYLLCDLSHPNEKLLDLLLITASIRQKGASSITLIAPYLPYMRQDKAFHQGEVVSAPIFSTLLTMNIDQLITVDPHLHRIHDLNDIIKNKRVITLHATTPIANWIMHHAPDSIVIGPDIESTQWISQIAEQVKLKYYIGTKTRIDDKHTRISLPDISETNKPFIIVDDIISSGGSLIELVRQLKAMGVKKIIAITVHALFNKEIYDQLLDEGLEMIISTNSIPHWTNKIDISEMLANAL